MLAGLERHQTMDCCGYEQRLPWCWTEEAAHWISQQLELLVFHIAGVVWGIALCWCWQCLLTVGGNLLPHIVTTLDVTTVSWLCRQSQDALQPAEHPPSAQLTLEWQCTASVFTMWHCSGRYNSLKVSVLSCWCLSLGITFHHCFPHCSSEEGWLYQNYTNGTTTEILPRLLNT